MEVLFSNEEIQLDKMNNGDFRVTLFNKDCHWDGEMVFNHKGIVYDDITEEETEK